MFTWKGVLDRGAYAWRCTVAVAILIGTVLLFPFLLKWLVAGTRCNLDTCGAVALAASVILRPILFVASLAMVLSICIRRSRHAGLRPWVGAFPPLMLAADQGFLQYAGSGWAYPFSSGASIDVPVYALFGAALMGLLGIPARDVLRRGRSRWIDGALVALGALILLGGAARVADFLVFTTLPMPLALMLLRLSPYASYAMPLLLALAAYCVWRSRSTAPAISADEPARAPETPNLWQPKRAALIGAAAAFAVLLWSVLVNSNMPFPMSLIGVLALLLPAFVPSFLIYAALAASILRLMARRDAIAVGAILVAMVPFGFWAASLASVHRDKAREQAAIAAISTTPLPASIDTVIIEGQQGWLVNCALSELLDKLRSGHG